MVTLLALLVLGQDRGVSIPCMVAPASRLLPDLGRQLGMKLVAGASIEDDVLAVVSPRRKPKEILDGIAKAANATWEVRSEVWTLTRTKKQALADEATDLAYTESALRTALSRIEADHPFQSQHAEALADFISGLVVTEEMTPERQEAFALASERSPSARLIKRLCGQLSLAQVARVPAGERRVFSTAPRKHQSRLEIKDLATLLATYRSEQQSYNDAILKKELPSITISTGNGYHDMDAPPSQWSTVNLTVDRSDSAQTSIFVQLMDAKRNVVKTIPLMLRTSTRGTTLPDITEATVTLDPLSLRANGAFANWLGRTKQQLEFFSEPLVRDPLEYVHRPALEAWSYAVDKPIFALLPDTSRFGRVSIPLKLRAYVGGLTRQLEISESADRVVLRPLQPYQASRQRVDRSNLQRFAEDCRKRGYVTIRSTVEFVGGNLDPFAPPLGDFKSLVDGVSETGPAQGFFPKLIQLAPPSMREELLNGATFQLEQLTTQQRTWLEACLFHRDHRSICDEVLTEGTEPPSDLTEAYPRGLPRGITLETNSSEAPFVNVKFYPTTNPYTSVFQASELASFIQEPKDHLYQVGPGRCLKVALKMPPGIQLTSEYREFRVPTDAPWVTFDKLPKSIQDDVFAKLKGQSKPPPH